MEHSSTSIIYQHSVSNNHPNSNISHFKIIDQDSKQVAMEAREAIHIRINNLALNHNMGKCTSRKSSTNFLEQMDLPMCPTQWETKTTHILTFALPGWPEKCVWQIKYPEHYYSLNWHPSQSQNAK